MEEGEGKQKISKTGILGFVESKYEHPEDANSLKCIFVLHLNMKFFYELTSWGP